MKTTTDIINILRTFKTACGKEYGIDTLALFGSTARGEQREDSDVDVCIHTSRAVDYFTLQDIKEKLQDMLETKVDLLTLHSNMFPLFRKNIERDAIYI